MTGVVAAPAPEGSSRGLAGVAARLRQRRALESLLALAVYSVFILWFTWPVAIHLGNTIYGAPGDLTGSIANLRELVEGHHNPFLAGRLPDFNAPEGQPISSGLNIAVWSSMSALYVLALAFGATAAFSLFTLGGYIASAYAMFLLTRRLYGNAWVALIVGFAYGYYPFVMVNGQGHNFFVHGWVFVLIAWRMLELSERATVRNGLWAAAAVIVAMSWAPYFILMGGVLFGTLLVADLVVTAVRHGDLRAHVRAQAVTGVVVVVYLAVLRLVTNGASSGELRTNPIDALYVYSARPLEYLLPPRSSVLLGDQAGAYLERHLHGSNFSESTLYLGLTMILAGLAGLVFAFLRRTDVRDRALALTFAAVGAVAFAFSAPPKVSVLGHLVPAPSWFVFQMTSTWRAYSRFVEVLMLAVSLLAAFALASVARRASRRVAIAVLVIATVAVPIDLYAKRLGGPRTTTLHSPPVYDVLKRQSPGGVAQYPLYPTGYGDYMELFYQDAYDKPLLNGYADTPQESRDLQLSNLAAPRTASDLAALGIRYVVVPDIQVSPPVQAPGIPGKAFKLLGTGAYGPTTASVYRVDAQPTPALPTFSAGFGDPEGQAGSQHRWMLAPSATLALDGRCDPCRGALSFTASSFGRPRTLTVSDARGRVLFRRRVTQDTRVSVPVTFARHVQVTLRTDPGPQPVRSVNPASPDTRSVSVYVGEVRFEAR